MPFDWSAQPGPDRVLVLQCRIILYQLMLRQRQRRGLPDDSIESILFTLRIINTTDELNRLVEFRRRVDLIYDLINAWADEQHRDAAARRG